MPRVKYIHKHIRIDHTRALITEYKREQKKHWDDIAPSVNMEPDSLKTKMSKGSDGFTVSFLRKIGACLQIPPDELSKAIAEDLTQ